MANRKQVMKKIRVIAIGAGKGGVGKSSLSLNVSIALQKQGKKVLLLDGDLGLANINVMLGQYSTKTIEHVLSGECHLKDIIVKGPLGLRFIPSSSGVESMASLSDKQHAGLIEAFNALEQDVDYLVVDTAAGLSDAVLSFMRSSQEIIIMVCDEPTSITDAYALIKVMNTKYKVNRFNIVANMVRTTKGGRQLYNKLYRASDQFLNVSLNYIGEVPFDPLVHKGIKEQRPVVMNHPHAKSSQAFKKIAKQVELLDWNKTPSGSTEFFLQRLVYG